MENKIKTNAISRPKTFARSALYRHREPRAMQFLSQRVTFWIATFSVFAFISGNMMGKLGWDLFWIAVFGGYDDSLIVYDGTVTPVEHVPDYSQWSKYGGNAEANTYRQVPRDLLRPLPRYDVSEQRRHCNDRPPGNPYSISFMGSYDTCAEGEGSHVGVDIDVPEGTPVRSVMHGIVQTVSEDPGGFGKYVVIRHPRVPDPKDPKSPTTLYSAYAHLSSTLVSEGSPVKKGEQIALSGKTGNASGPHLHFDIDREEAPWHPYWAFSWSEMREAGLTFSQAINAGLGRERGYQYTVNPMLYVQANYPPVAGRVATASSSSRVRLSSRELAKRRREERVARRGTTVAIVTPVSSSSVSSPNPVVVQTETIAAAETPEAAFTLPEMPPTLPQSSSLSYEIRHDGSFTGREWETVKLSVIDPASGREIGKAPPGDIHLRLAYGNAEFDPPVLSPLDFKVEDGRSFAIVRMLPRGSRTVIIQLQPGGVMSMPMKYAP